MSDRWNGFSDATSDIGDGMTVVENVSFIIDRELGRRPGLGAKVADSGWVAGEVGSYAILARSDGKIDAVNQTSGGASTLRSGYDTTNRPVMAQAFKRIYITNNVDAVQVSDDGTNIRDAGIVAPVSAPTVAAAAGGSVGVGTHLVRYRYQDQTRARLSDPSPAASITIASGTQTLNVTPTASGSSYVTNIIIEVTAAGASTYYRANIGANATALVAITMDDASLIQQVPSSRDGDFSHEPPPITPLLIEHRNRVWWWNEDGTLGWSRAGFPESFDSVNYASLISLDTGDSPAGLASYYSDLYCIGTRSMRRLVFTTDPATAMILTVPGVLGVFHQRCVCPAGSGLLFGWGRDGIWRINSMQPEKISQNIETSLASLADNSRTTERFVVFDPIQREVLFFFCAVGETACRLAFVWHIDQQEWSLWRFRQAMQAGCQNSAYVDRQRLMLCDANGYSWRVFSGYNDGSPDNGVVTAQASSTTTSVKGTNTAIVGQMLYRPATGEERLITSASVSAIGLTDALGTAPAVGETFYVGSIRQRWVTQWLMMHDMGSRKRSPRFRVTVRPNNANGQTMGLLKVYFYRDFSLSPTAIGAGYPATDVNYSGVSTGATYVQVDLDAAMADNNAAFLSLPTPGEWARAWQVELIAETPGNGVRLYDIAFEMDDASVGPGQEG